MEPVIRQLLNEDFPALVELNAKFYKTLPVTQDAFNATANLVKDVLQQPNFTAWGLFEGDKLVGFVTGYALSKKSFYFSGLYVIIRLNRNLKQLIEFCFREVAEKGFTTWEVDCTNKNITSMMEKYGAAPIYTRYVKNTEA